jgi:glycosyltransferase involved in cell wall biosynthesis
MRVIGNALDPAHFMVKPDKVAGRLVFCSDPSRGLHLLLPIFQRLRERVPHATLHVYWSELPTELKAAVEGTPGVSFQGRVPQSALALALGEAQLMIYPNQSHETYCMAALEAQAAGVVVIARNYSGIATTVGTRGVLVAGDPQTSAWQDEALEAALSLLQNPSLLSSTSARAREWALTQTWDSVAAQWAQLVL